VGLDVGLDKLKQAGVRTQLRRSVVAFFQPPNADCGGFEMQEIIWEKIAFPKWFKCLPSFYRIFHVVWFKFRTPRTPLGKTSKCRHHIEYIRIYKLVQM